MQSLFWLQSGNKKQKEKNKKEGKTKAGGRRVRKLPCLCGHLRFPQNLFQAENVPFGGGGKLCEVEL